VPVVIYLGSRSSMSILRLRPFWLTPKNVIRVHEVRQAARPCEPVWIGCKSFTLAYKLRQLCKRRNSLKDGGIYLHVVSSEYPKLLRAYLDFQVQLIVII
jgi:hypothetical protein